MLNRLFPRRKAQPKPLPQPNAQLALGALLVRVAFADRNYRASEIGQIDQILARTFGLKPIEAAKLRATCEALERDAPGTPEFTRILREEVEELARLGAVYIQIDAPRYCYYVDPRWRQHLRDLGEEPNRAFDEAVTGDAACLAARPGPGASRARAEGRGVERRHACGL